MIDSHCHIDLYPNPSKLILQTERNKIITILVTNLPSFFEIAYSHVKGFRYIRLALGLHPLFAHKYSVEKRLFEKFVDQTSYIGEVGLDFSAAGISTKEIQIESFKFVLKAIRNKPKFMSIHSRKAESEVLDGLEEENRAPVVFHWYSGPLNLIDRALSLGHYFSINPAMINTKHGRKIIEKLPFDRVLTETDGPFVKMQKRTAYPKDVSLVENYLSEIWQMNKYDTSKNIKNNFYKLINPLKIIY